MNGPTLIHLEKKHWFCFGNSWSLLFRSFLNLQSHFALERLQFLLLVMEIPCLIHGPEVGCTN
jgi:hypothetical protein